MARMTKDKIKKVDKVMETINQKTVERESQQERFNQSVDPSKLFWSIYRWLKYMDYEEPMYEVDSRRRDEWLRQFVQREPFLNGVLSTVITIDKNRNWILYGGERLVKKYTNILHNFHAAADLTGWRAGVSVTAQNYYCTDIGSIVEVETTKGNGVLTNLYTVDSAKCRLTGDRKKPLGYKSEPQYQEKLWKADSYFRVVDMPNTDERMLGLGICAVSRCIEMAKIMIALYEHDKEKLLAKAPKGLMLLKGITEQEWIDSTAQKDAEMSALERRYYAGIQVLASSGLTDIDAKIISLSEIPENLDHMTFSNLIMYLYALCFKYDPREFWPVSGGQLGTATETETQHKKATGKGGSDFQLAFQEKIQAVLPATIDFEFESRDVEGDQMDEAYKGAVIGNILKLITPVAQGMEPLISISQARELLSEYDIIPPEWLEEAVAKIQTTAEEDNPDDTTTNLNFQGGYDEQTQSNYSTIYLKDAVQRSISIDPLEPIVVYNSRKKTFTRIPMSPKKRSYHILRAGNMDDLSKHIENTIGSEAEGFFDRCMDMDELQNYDEETRAAICARAHKDVVGKWPREKMKKYVLVKPTLETMNPTLLYNRSIEMQQRRMDRNAVKDFIEATDTTELAVNKLTSEIQGMVERISNLSTPNISVEPPQVVVNLPEIRPQITIQPAPAGDIKVDVAAPNVTIEPAQVTNEITVQPAELKLPAPPKAPRKAKVKTDIRGNVTEVEFNDK